jgi:Lar family restriction alleviation protein
LLNSPAGFGWPGVFLSTSGKKGNEIMEDLKPCPFCGGRAILLGGPKMEELCTIWCAGCQIHVEGGFDAVYLIERWNRRVEHQESPRGRE